MTSLTNDMHFPHPEPPAAGEVIGIADGVLWTRLPLPFQLNHINIYLIEDNGGWAVLDTGISDETTRAIWRTLQKGALKGMRLTRIIVSHFHPDHVGLADWLCRTFEAPLLTSETCYSLTARLTSPESIRENPTPDEEEYYINQGVAPSVAKTIIPPEASFGKVADSPPAEYIRIEEGTPLSIGGRNFNIFSGNGHADNQLMLYASDGHLLFAADQIMARISPNVSVLPENPDKDALLEFIMTLKRLMASMPEDSLVLPGHERPFYGLVTRAQQLIEHHEERCALIINACIEGPQSVADLLMLLFTRPLYREQMAMAFGETLAHVNYLVNRGDLMWVQAEGNNRKLITS